MKQCRVYITYFVKTVCESQELSSFGWLKVTPQRCIVKTLAQEEDVIFLAVRQSKVW